MISVRDLHKVFRVMRSIELFGTEIIPRFRREDARGAGIRAS